MPKLQTSNCHNFLIKGGCRFLIQLLYVAYIKRKGLKTTHTEERRTHTNSRSCNILLRQQIIQLNFKLIIQILQPINIEFNLMHSQFIFHNIFHFLFKNDFFQRYASLSSKTPEIWRADDTWRPNNRRLKYSCIQKK